MALWIHACRRPKLNLTTLSYHRFICSLHFVGENGPTSENPDPAAATMSIGHQSHLEQAYQRATGKRPLSTTYTISRLLISVIIVGLTLPTKVKLLLSS